MRDWRRTGSWPIQFFAVAVTLGAVVTGCGDAADDLTETAAAPIESTVAPETTVAPDVTVAAPATDAPVVDDATSAPAVRGDLAWETSAQMLFANGLSREDLEHSWDGYPYGAEERSDRIDTYLEDFAWIQDAPILLELNQFFAFGEPGEFFEAIITVHSEPAREQSAAFVGGWDGESFRLGRLPESGEAPRVIAADESSVTIEGVGTEGSPAAFYFAEELDVAVDYEALTTRVNLPSNYVPSDPITVVFPTPELAGARVIRSP